MSTITYNQEDINILVLKAREKEQQIIDKFLTEVFVYQDWYNASKYEDNLDWLYMEVFDNINNNIVPVRYWDKELKTFLDNKSKLISELREPIDAWDERKLMFICLKLVSNQYEHIDYYVNRDCYAKIRRIFDVKFPYHRGFSKDENLFILFDEFLFKFGVGNWYTETGLKNLIDYFKSQLKHINKDNISNLYGLMTTASAANRIHFRAFKRELKEGSDYIDELMNLYELSRDELITTYEKKTENEYDLFADLEDLQVKYYEIKKELIG